MGPRPGDRRSTLANPGPIELFRGALPNANGAGRANAVVSNQRSGVLDRSAGSDPMFRRSEWHSHDRRKGAVPRNRLAVRALRWVFATSLARIRLRSLVAARHGSRHIASRSRSLRMGTNETRWQELPVYRNPSFARRAERSGDIAFGARSTLQANSANSASNRSRPSGVRAACRGVRLPSAGSRVSIQASQ